MKNLIINLILINKKKKEKKKKKEEADFHVHPDITKQIDVN